MSSTPPESSSNPRNARDLPLGPWEAALARLGRRLDADAGLREDVAALLRLATVGLPESMEAPKAPEAPETSEAPPAAEPDMPPVPLSPAGESRARAVVQRPPSPESLAELARVFGGGPDGAAVPEAAGDAVPVTAAVIQRRLRLKLAAMRLRLESARAAAAGGRPGVPPFRELIAEARELPDCYLWMCHRQYEGTPEEAWREALDCFEALKRAHGLVVGILECGGPVPLKDALAALAAASSATRVVVEKRFGTEDADQAVIFGLLDKVTVSRRVYIKRHMRRSDPADPRDMPALLEAVAAMEAAAGEAEMAEKEKKRLRKKIDWELKHAARASDAEVIEHWTKAIACVEDLLKQGVPADSPEWRSLIGPHLEDLPAALEEIPAGFQSVLRAIDAWEASREPAAVEAAVEDAETEDVRRVREALAGSCLVVIGGDRREQARQQLMRAFKLADLNWVETRPHEPTRGFEPAIARDDVKVVLLAIRWSSHQFGDVRAYCEAYGKRLVRLPAGYGVNRVAHEICTQGAMA